jgi:hypothetical protein
MKAARTASSRTDDVKSSDETEGNAAGSIRARSGARLGSALRGEGVPLSGDWTLQDEVHRSTDRNRQIIGLVGPSI